MKKVVSALLKYGIPVAISVGLAWFLYKNVDIDAIKKSLQQDVNYWWFVPVIVVSIMSHVFRALRWRLQLRAIDVHPPLLALVNSIFGTYFVNLLFPRLGEVWRTSYIARRERASFSQVLGSMVGDRLSDTVVVALLTLVTFFLAQDAFLKFLGQRGGEEANAWIVMGVGVLCLVGIASLVWIYRSTSENVVLARARAIVRDLWQGLATIAKMEGKWQPRLHDLRHTFAVNRLVRWYQEGKDVQRLLPLLSTYLGHTKISSTSIYLSMTNSLLKEANSIFHNYALGGGNTNE